MWLLEHFKLHVHRHTFAACITVLLEALVCALERGKRQVFKMRSTRTSPIRLQRTVKAKAYLSSTLCHSSALRTRYSVSSEGWFIPWHAASAKVTIP